MTQLSRGLESPLADAGRARWPGSDGLPETEGAGVSLVEISFVLWDVQSTAGVEGLQKREKNPGSGV